MDEGRESAEGKHLLGPAGDALASKLEVVVDLSVWKDEVETPISLGVSETKDETRTNKGRRRRSR